MCRSNSATNSLGFRFCRGSAGSAPLVEEEEEVEVSSSSISSLLPMADEEEEKGVADEWNRDE